jgi:phosphoesterase RecJ-like protein
MEKVITEKIMIDNKEFASYSVRQAAQLFADKSNVLILFHVNPDGDATGSAFALRCALEAMGKRAFCVCSCEIPDRLLFISSGIQDSVLHESIPNDFNADMTVSVDTASPSQLGSLYETYGGKIDLMIDHHGKSTPYADGCVVTDASSCGEIIYELVGELATHIGYDCGKLPSRFYEQIYTAVSSDTGCFRYNNVTPATHILAGRLIEKGVDGADINHRLFGIKTLKQMQVEHAGFERMNFYLGGKIAVIAFPYDLKNQYGATDENLETLVDVARCVKGVEVAAVIKQPSEENRFRVSMRSSCDFDVSEICAHYGGGGHARAAGCTLIADSILSAEMTVVVAIEHKMQDALQTQE